MQIPQTYDQMGLAQYLFDNFRTYRLNKKQYAEVVNQSVATVNRRMKSGFGIAQYQKFDNGRVYFNVFEVAKFLCNGTIRVY